ncbi:hypothetical protein G6F46_011470 [Rhizopus delemar]|uniref:Phospholipid/glycerol acyltransferase domain-containing protein n=2 Tax=Rhizopus TaxID=4842 RepID=A0A9P6YT23_9FUNG|nr:hypothetical protein G6F43_009678 [Rhizopus delemar]KAG1537874.1 hypothetical protein G6F51_010109 [Rhizopus arrhizus]KAG1447935.1 hypothetical protein G6F55_010887 [Rhizopus delemar]KAG1489864.1 hypothetical protein G6F54_011138 [Rhizopus delemar]KAG1500476.1 hypothetical protein G6F53_011298 [Rhizopus delemar]
MEKYSRWRDAGTGIQPFLPPVPPRTDSSFLVTLSNIVHTIAGSVQGLIKLPVILLLSLCYVLFVSILGTLLTPIKPLKRAWQTLFSTILTRCILFFMGFFHIKTETVSIRKSRGNIKSGSVKDGDIIISNWTSYVDILYLAYKFNPVFTQVYSNTTQVKKISLWQAIRSVNQIPPATPTSTVYDIKELSLKAKEQGWGPIVIFPEGTTTNGRALLKFVPLSFDDVDLNRFHLLSFKYEYGSMPPTFTIGNQWIHFFKLCSQFHNSLNVRMLAKGELDSDILASLGHLSKLRKTNLTMNDKRDFLVYYESRNKKKAA